MISIGCVQFTVYRVGSYLFPARLVVSESLAEVVHGIGGRVAGEHVVSGEYAVVADQSFEFLGEWLVGDPVHHVVVVAGS